MKTLDRSIHILFYLLFFLTPIIFYPKTSELFEFNKIVYVYLTTILITTLWTIKNIYSSRSLKDFLNKYRQRTLLDLPLLLLISVTILTTLSSIDIRTSVFGYYSRFNGGLLSIIAFSLLFWAFIHNMRTKQTLKTLFILLTSGFIVSVVAIAERLGYYPTCVFTQAFQESSSLSQALTTNCWFQNVQARVFATLGQPNWLAAWIVAIIPLTWIFMFDKIKIRLWSRSTSINKYIWVILSALFFAVLLFTKSRSGLLGFTSAFVVFWTIAFIKFRSDHKFVKSKMITPLTIITSSFLLISFVFGTSWTQGLIREDMTASARRQRSETPEIRKIVWIGAISILKENVLLGTGPETFAYSYPKYRPQEHNLTFEWEYIYNKAHNEYLNYAANMGIVGLTAYLILVGSTLYLFINFIRNDEKLPKIESSKSPLVAFELSETSHSLVSIGLLAGYISLLVTNFFGFSVVLTTLLFFAYPAIAISLLKEKEQKETSVGLIKLAFIIVISSIGIYLLNSLANYWKADYLYTSSVAQSKIGDLDTAREEISMALKLSKSEPIFWSELSSVSTRQAVSLTEKGDMDLAKILAESSVEEGQFALLLSPSNPTLIKKQSSNLIQLSGIDGKYLEKARDTLERATISSPTDAKLLYNLALAQIRTDQRDKAQSTLEKAIALKANYIDARYAHALLQKDKGEIVPALKEARYILDTLDSSDTKILQLVNELEEL